jgi:hypothetical protein
MKRIILIIFIELLIFNVIASKDIEGTILTKNDSVIHVVFKIPTDLLTGDIRFDRIQNKIQYYNSDGKMTTVRPDQVKGISFSNNDIRMISCQNNVKQHLIFSFTTQKFIFLRLEKMGKMKLFRYYYMPKQNNLPELQNVFVLQKDEGDLLIPEWFSEFDYIKKYINECPDLITKIDNKIYTYKNIEEIVTDFNNCVE